MHKYKIAGLARFFSIRSVVVHFLAVLACLLANIAYANTVTTSSIWPAGQVKTKVTNISGGLQTSFTGYVAGPYNYVIYPFTVDTTGTYTATSVTTNIIHTSWILNGVFSPSFTTPSTPLSDYIFALLASGSGPYTGVYSGIPLVAGRQYSVLVAFNTGSVSGDLSTLTISGPGCIAFGTDTCLSNVAITGTPQVGATLTGTYSSASTGLTFRWMAGGRADGDDKQPIAGATGTTYSPAATDVGKNLFFCVKQSSGAEVCSSAFALVSSFTSVAPVTGVAPTLLTPLDLSSGYGPTLANCMTDTIRQVLGADAAYQGQVNGAARVSQGGKIISFYPFRASTVGAQGSGVAFKQSNALYMATACGSLEMAPALYNPGEFGAALNAMGLSASINATGVIVVNVGNNVYVVRPDYFVTPGQRAGTGLTVGSDGMFRFTDSAGNSQILRPAFLSPETLQTGVSSVMGGYLVIQADGSGLFTSITGSQFVLSPDMVLGATPAAFSTSSWWSDGPNHFRIPAGFLSQGLTLTPK